MKLINYEKFYNNIIDNCDNDYKLKIVFQNILECICYDDYKYYQYYKFYYLMNWIKEVISGGKTRKALMIVGDSGLYESTFGGISYHIFRLFLNKICEHDNIKFHNSDKIKQISDESYVVLYNNFYSNTYEFYITNGYDDIGDKSNFVFLTQKKLNVENINNYAIYNIINKQYISYNDFNKLNYYKAISVIKNITSTVNNLTKFYSRDEFIDKFHKKIIRKYYSTKEKYIELKNNYDDDVEIIRKEYEYKINKLIKQHKKEINKLKQRK
jgi:hypothetical protein